MKIPAFAVIYKFALIALLLVSLGFILLSGVGLYFDLNPWLLRHLHLIAAIVLITALALHIWNRKNKLVKLQTQFTDLIFHNQYPSYCNLERLLMSVEHCSVAQISRQFQLDQQVFLHHLSLGRIVISDIHQPLRQIFPHNDEKIFAIMSIAIQLAFSSSSPKKEFL